MYIRKNQCMVHGTQWIRERIHVNVIAAEVIVLSGHMGTVRTIARVDETR